MGHFEYGKWVDDPKPKDELDELLERGDGLHNGSSRIWDQGPKCRHQGEPVRGVARLLGSSYRAGWAVGHMTLKVALAREALEVLPQGGSSVYWWPIPDMKAPPGNEDTIRRLLHLYEMHKLGHTIEVACFGGHGRTGTVLAILAALVQGWKPEEAVRLLREAYCERAVESAVQEWFVEKAITACRMMLAGQKAEMPAPPAPAPIEHEDYPGERVTGPEPRPDRTQKLGGFAGLRERNEHIRDLRRLGMSLADIADETGLSPNRVSEIVNGK